MRLTLEVKCDNDLASDIPTSAKVTVTRDFADRIRRLGEVARREGLDYVQVFDYAPVWLRRKKAERMDCELLEVSPKDFRWTATVKHTDLLCYTERVSLEDLPSGGKVSKGTGIEGRISAMEKGDLAKIVRTVVSGLYYDGERNRYDPDHEWDSDTLDAIAAIIATHGLVPKKSREG